MALILATELKNLGYTFLTEPASNQIFPILPDIIIETLRNKYAFYIWSKVNQTHSAIRLVTSWATKESTVIAFLENIKDQKQI